ncbi:MAG: hypothetical protein U0984_05110, partial [Prosthecobacter sp.]|nr:hypothetical protein [Prosthecobacter sp.]
MSQTRVYILGAGCSVCGGYPLAWEVRKALEDFAKDNLQVDETKELRRCVEKTCELMDQHGIQTTDQLAQALGEDRRAEIEESKKAMSALFFSLEDVAVEKAYSQYARLFEELFEQGESPLMEDRVMATNCRVLTYNYDRLFERAFIKWALPQAERSDANAISKAVEWLNSSLRNPSTAEFVPDRFALLKLHGGI